MPICSELWFALRRHCGRFTENEVFVPSRDGTGVFPGFITYIRRTDPVLATCAGRGERANGNWPRSPLYVAELQESPFALKRDTITVIDQRGPSDSPRTQISNFRYYQDRQTGDVVVFATRFGERDAQDWKRADYYRYRVAVA